MEINGKTLKITPAGFDLAFELQQEVALALKGTKINLDSLEMNQEVSAGLLDTILQSVLSVATSKKVSELLFQCAERAVLGTDKIDKDFFEKVENREYYYPIMFELLKVNVGPFINRLGSLFQGLGGNLTNFLKPK